MKKAFTLSEMLVCLAIIGTLVVLFLSTIRVKPNSNMVIFRKAYNITSNTVYEMLQSAVYYGNGMLNNLNATSQKIEGEYPSGNTKFCKVFASYINTAGEINCNNGAGPSFSTLDGIAWYLPPKTTPGTFAGREKIRVDINGEENQPNCQEKDSNCDEPDIFEFEISDIGKIYIEEDLAKKYLQNNRNISK